MEEFLENLKSKDIEKYNNFVGHTAEWQEKQYNSIAKVSRLKQLKDENKILSHTNLNKLVSWKKIN